MSIKSRRLRALLVGKQFEAAFYSEHFKAEMMRNFMLLGVEN